MKKISWQRSILLHWYRHIHHSYQNWTFICIYSERYRKGFNNLNYEVERPLGMSENNKLLAMMKDQFLLKGKLWIGEKGCTNKKMPHKNLPKFDDNKNCLKEKKYEWSFRSFRKTIIMLMKCIRKISNFGFEIK